jgi:hypothetical protein
MLSADIVLPSSVIKTIDGEDTDFNGWSLGSINKGKDVTVKTGSTGNKYFTAIYPEDLDDTYTIIIDYGGGIPQDNIPDSYQDGDRSTVIRYTRHVEGRNNVTYKCN